jgi:LAO/AO transport system kinase
VIDGAALAARLRDRDHGAAPAVLNLVENQSQAARSQTVALLEALSPAALGGEAPAHIVGVTGPPGVGKSSLLSRLVAGWRARGHAVAVLAVDPSSRRSGGALLGDRARIQFDPSDRAVFIRSTAAGERVGGLATPTRAAASALAVAFDVVVIETVGAGQSETEIADLADTVAVVVQPGAGDGLQFLKAGIMEVPDVLVVTKADLGAVATQTLADARAAISSLGTAVAVLAVSSTAPPTGIAELLDAPGACAGGGCTRWPTSPPSTASAACGRWAGDARPSAGSPSRTPASTSPRWGGRSRSGPASAERGAASGLAQPAACKAVTILTRRSRRRGDGGGDRSRSARPPRRAPDAASRPCCTPARGADGALDVDAVLRLTRG